MRKIYFLLVFLFFNFTYSQNCEDKVIEVYENIINSIGNKSKWPPELDIRAENVGGAYMDGSNIVIGQKLINLFCNQPNFEDKISFILAHELAHYYLDHKWMSNTGLSYANPIRKSLKYQQAELEEIKKVETQADIYAGFYGQISGYQTLAYAEETILEIYEAYNLPKDLKKYPSLDGRISIVKDKTKQANDLSTTFEIASILLKLNEFEMAKELFNEILQSNFNSREIYNNLGISYLMYGISISDPIVSETLFPVYIDFETRSKVSKTRAGNFFDNPKKMFENSKRYFNWAIDLDKDYLPAKQNLFVAEYLIADGSDKKELVLDNILRSNLAEEIKVDFEVIQARFKNVKPKKIQKIAKRGTEISMINAGLSEIKLSEKNKGTEILKEIGLWDEISSWYIMGFPKRKSERINLPNQRLYKYILNEVEIFYLSDENLLFKLKNSLIKEEPIKDKMLHVNNNYFMLFKLE